jgi:hypothetical protein
MAKAKARIRVHEMELASPDPAEQQPAFPGEDAMVFPGAQAGTIETGLFRGWVAEILLPNGKVKLIRDGDKCKTTRE